MADRRSFTKNALAFTMASLAFPALGANVGKHKKKRKEDIILGHGDYRYKLIRDWANISSVRNPILNCHEMVMDKQGRLIMIGDHPQNNILIFDKSGKLLDYWGTAYPGGHGLSIAEEGEEEFLYLTDSGWFLDKQGKWTKHNGRVSKT
ncbi:MAG: 6-bladed beta-propeller, partial [Bacteroidota bacterium]